MLKKLLQQSMGRTASVNKEKPSCNLCFVHIPKCAGQSVVWSLRQCYAGMSSASIAYRPALESFNRYNLSFTSAAEREAEWGKYRAMLLDYSLGKGVACVYGHFPCPTKTLEHFSESYRFITVLREPVARFISNYIYDRTGPMKGHYTSDLSPAEELHQYLDSKEAYWMANTQVAMIGGHTHRCESLEPCLEAAQANLKQYSVVGFTEDLAGFSSLMGERLGLKLDIHRVNTTSKWTQDDAKDFDYYSLFGDEAKQRIAELGSLDMQLYQHAQSL